MKKVTLVLISTFLITSLFAQIQSVREEISLQFSPAVNHFQTGILAIPLEQDGPFLSYYVKSGQQLSGLGIRFSVNGSEWGAWLPLNPESHMEFEDASWISELGFEETGARWFQVAAPVNYLAVTCYFFNPGHTGEVHQNHPPDPENSDRSCPCPMPVAQTRAQWCPSGTCYPHPDPSYTNVTHLIVHHSAGTNTASDWAAVVRSIWDFHVNGNGWSDIGYNWLIDPNGVVYEGRGNDILGAHFCGTNGGTAGTCVMGNFTDIQPTTDAINALIELYTWKSCDKGFSPVGTAFHPSSGFTLNRISGHRDGCATACPGDSFYPLLPEIRQQMFDHIVAGCSGLAGPTSLEGMLTGTTEATLTWSDNTTGELGYLLERKGGDVPDFELFATSDPDVTEFIDNTVETSTVYTYRLRAFTETDTSAYSNEAVVSDNVSTYDPFINEQTITFFPNPVQETLSMRIDNNLTGRLYIEVLDILSKTMQLSFSVEKETARQEFKVGVSSLPRGIYLLKIQQEDHNGLFRIVVE